jgi:hypothetical protein
VTDLSNLPKKQMIISPLYIYIFKKVKNITVKAKSKMSTLDIFGNLGSLILRDKLADLLIAYNIFR